MGTSSSCLNPPAGKTGFFWYRRPKLIRGAIGGLVLSVALSTVLSIVYLSRLGEVTSVPSDGDSPKGDTRPREEATAFPLQEFVLKGYDPLVGFTSTLQLMRVVDGWEGVGSGVRTATLDESPCTLLWTAQDTTALEGTFGLSVRREGVSTWESIDTGAGVSHVVWRGTGRHEIAVQAVDVRWKLWVFLESQG